MASTDQAPRVNRTRGAGIPRSILQEQNWPQALIEDYDRISQNDFFPLCGTAAPNNNITSNSAQTYFRISGSIRQFWFNPVVGVNTGWVQLI